LFARVPQAASKETPKVPARADVGDDAADSGAAVGRTARFGLGRVYRGLEVVRIE
jgi:hypothetical protein